MLQFSQSDLLQIFAEVLEVDSRSLPDDSSPENVEKWDSAKSMEIVIMLEEALDLEFSANEIAEMVSIGPRMTPDWRRCRREKSLKISGARAHVGIEAEAPAGAPAAKSLRRAISAAKDSYLPRKAGRKFDNSGQ
jgi:acyl carrier protein